MNKLLFVLLLVSVSSLGQESEVYKNPIKENLLNFSDGPYVFIEKNKLIEKKIVDGVVYSNVLTENSYDTIYTSDKSTFKNINKIAALSDIHGQYDLVIKLLNNNGIIDEDLNWTFGDGHLVIVGDIFDRGDKVNEVLWLIYNLEIQAKNKGGNVHFLLGNHEYMILQKDLRYINEKYKLSSTSIGLEYDELYSNKTIIGRWLRSKSTIIKINNNIFTHGGVSKDFITKNDISLEKINNIMRESIDLNLEEMMSTDFYDIYYGRESLIWYRGYFYSDLTERQLTQILKKLDAEHIIVGHSSNHEVVQLYNNKIFGVDSSIKMGKYGELLIIANNEYYRGVLSGEIKNFQTFGDL